MDVLKMVCGDPAGDDVEAAVLERKVFGAGDHVRPHPRGRVDGDNCAASLTEAPGDVTAAGRNVEHLDRGTGLAPLDEQIEIGSFPVCRALAERVGTL
jgi:hypothetical protein